MKTQIATCKESLTFVIPKEAVAELGWASGDIIDVSVADGRMNATRVMTNHEHTMQIAREVMEKYRDTFEALAKM